jgi:hypothetical protein
MRAGDFSELNRVIYDPITHLPFPGNVIPPAVSIWRRRTS